jgi:hypothetical protein
MTGTADPGTDRLIPEPQPASPALAAPAGSQQIAQITPIEPAGRDDAVIGRMVGNAGNDPALRYPLKRGLGLSAASLVQLGGIEVR